MTGDNGGEHEKVEKDGVKGGGGGNELKNYR